MRSTRRRAESFAVRERRRTELTVAFHFSDPLARVILSHLHLDAEVAAEEVSHIDAMIDLAACVMALGQKRGEIPADRDPRFIGAMIIRGHAARAGYRADQYSAHPAADDRGTALVLQRGDHGPGPGRPLERPAEDWPDHWTASCAEHGATTASTWGGG